MEMVSAAGFEPTAPGFIPLRLSPPPFREFVVWTVPSPSTRTSLGAARPVSTPSRRAGLGSGLAWRHGALAFPDFEQIRCAVSPRNAQLH
ncbi:hypothetical protein C5F48_08520 [Cereibacter changlensis JA139]|uniref:Uncharacterized protein n=1 Tax=Cereibacter changlensis JA139 TaxID=1188249 RepID=A0A2T4JW59_9RHOB|nr:hypothetical protein C5F48_08520 [Cereibacter changlensis JA139]